MLLFLKTSPVSCWRIYLLLFSASVYVNCYKKVRVLNTCFCNLLLSRNQSINKGSQTSEINCCYCYNFLIYVNYCKSADSNAINGIYITAVCYSSLIIAISFYLLCMIQKFCEHCNNLQLKYDSLLHLCYVTNSDLKQ